MKKLLILITLVLGFISMSFASYTPTQKESQTLELIKSKLESLVKNDSKKADSFKTQLNSLKEKHSNNERATYILDYLLDIFGGESNTLNSLGVLNSLSGKNALFTGVSLIVLPERYDENLQGARPNIKSYLLNGSGVMLLPYAYTKLLSEGLIAVRDADGKRYYLDESGAKVSGPYDKAGDFINGYARVFRDGNQYFIDKNFKEIAGPYKWAQNFSEGYALGCRNDIWYFIDENGKEVKSYESASSFVNGYATIYRDNNRYFVDKNFKEVAGPYTQIIEEFKNGYAVVRKYSQKKEYIIDSSFKEIFSTNDSIEHIDKDYIRVKLKTDDNNWYLLDKNFKEVIGPNKYKGIGEFKDGYAVVVEYDGTIYYNGVPKYIDKNFKEVGDTYKDITEFSSGYAAVLASDGYRYYIDTSFKQVSGPFFAAKSFSNGIALIKKNDGKWYVINTNFQEITGPLDEPNN